MNASLASSILRSRRALIPVAIGVAAIVGTVQATTVAAQTPPAASPPDSVARGAAVFAQNCQVCHGINAQGRIGPPLFPLPPEIAGAPRPALIQELTGLVRGGIPGAMPRFLPQQVSDDDVASLVDWFLDTNTHPEIPPERSFYAAMSPVQPTNDPSIRFFAETNHSLAAPFRAFWEQNGGARIFGNPITEPFQARAPQTGEMSTLQLFQNVLLVADRGGAVSVAPLGSEWMDIRTGLLIDMGEGGGPGGPPANGE